MISVNKWSKAVTYLCQMAPIAKFKCEPFSIIQMLDKGTIFWKTYHEENKYFKTENMCLLLL